MQGPPPRLITPGRGLPSYGRRVAAVSAALGTPFLPWQRQVSTLLNEYDPATLLRVHPFMVVTVQRQAGKTTWLQAEAVERCMFLPRARVWYTAQSGLYARGRWTETAQQLLAPGSPLLGRVSARWSAGQEQLTFPQGGWYRPFPPTRDTLHGQQSDLVILDEGWRHSPERGGELLQAIGPTQATRPGAQVVVVSTQGTAASRWLHDLVDRGRSGDPDITYAEWGIGGGDPMDLELVAACHPAVGFTITPEFLAQQATLLSPSEFARAYGNVRTAAESRYITTADWQAVADPQASPADPVVLCAAVAQDRSRTAIVAVSGGVVEVIESKAGTDWALYRLVELVSHQPAALVIDPRGPSAALADAAAQAKLPLWDWKLDVVGASDPRPAACLAFMDALVGHRLRIRPHHHLDEAADAAVPRPTGDGWVWGRRLAGGPIPELEATTWGYWVDSHRPQVAVAPRVITTD